MTQPVWITPAGNLGVIPVGVFFQLTLSATDPDLPGPDAPLELNYAIIAGTLPSGIQCSANGIVSGTPDSVASVQGVPLPVAIDTTSKFTVRAYDPLNPSRLADRTFTITIAVIPEPVWVTPAGNVGTYYDSDAVDFQFQFEEVYAPDDTTVTLIAGQLPGGLVLHPSGLLDGYIQPAQDILNLAGYDLSEQDVDPYDFLSSSISKNYQFTLEVSNGRSSSIRTFEIYVYSRNQMQASDDVLVDNNTFITADETTYQAPFLVNRLPSNLGTAIRSNNYFAYQFIGENYISQPITYAISVNEGAGLPPGLTLDPYSGWYYGYIPDQGTTQIDYSFNIVVYQSEFITPTVIVTRTQDIGDLVTASGTNQLNLGQPIILSSNFNTLVAGVTYYVDTIVSETAIWNATLDEIIQYDTVFTLVNDDSSIVTVTNQTGAVSATVAIECTATNSGTNIIECYSTSAFGLGQPIVFTGTAFGGVTANPNTVYYVSELVSATEFKVSAYPNSTDSVTLLTASGIMYANMILASTAYPFTMTIVGDIGAEVTWITPADLGSIVNGSVSLLKVEAVNRGGRTMRYRLKSGAYNTLPQALELMPSGDIVGRVSFDTFALDLGATTFDQSYYENRNVGSLGTTFDSTYVFTVNAYAPDTNQTIYSVSSITVVDGGSGYSSVTPPTIAISAPVGASAVPAIAGNVTITSTAISAVEVLEAGDGYTEPPTVTVTQGFGGSGAELEAVMAISGSRDVISVYKTFTVRVIREYNRPYQNLYVRALPPPNDRALVRSLLDNEEIFPPEYIFRPDDVNFGKSRQVTYAHAFGLAPDTLERYVASLYENHYWKNLILGEINTAQALDPITGEVIYEVVYSKIIDNLVNNAGESVNKIVTLPYAIIDPADGSTIITSVYPNSLVNMRDQVIDVVGQISTTLPGWMTSKQPNGRVLGFTPAWVIAYVNPGRANEIAYFISAYFEQQLNAVDFKVDRYILDRSLSRNWDTDTQQWTPESSLTTFDRFSTGSRIFIGSVTYATNLAYSDVNQRTIDYIDDLGGLDGIANIQDGDTIIFVKQEDYDGPPGSSYPTTDAGWQDYIDLFGTSYDSETFADSVTIPNDDGFGVNPRMAIYTLNVDAEGLVTATLTTNTAENQYVNVSKGDFYSSASLYYPTSPGEGLTQISWLPQITVLSTETIFDEGSLQFIAPVDMYNPTDTYDKYLVFPKSNILV